MTKPRKPLSPRQIAVMKMLAKRGGRRPVSLPKGLRLVANSLWRRDLVEIWYQQARGHEPALRGPFYALTISGGALADIFLEHESRRLARSQGRENGNGESSEPQQEAGAGSISNDGASRGVLRVRDGNERRDNSTEVGTQLSLLGE